MKFVQGMEKLVLDFKATTKRHAKGIERGIKKAGAYLLGKSMEIVPVDTGVLRASSFIRSYGKGLEAAVAVGYTASYAIYVHEDLTKAHGAEYNRKYAADIAAGRKTNRGENQQAKFLEKPFREGKRMMVQIVTNEVKRTKK